MSKFPTEGKLAIEKKKEKKKSRRRRPPGLTFPSSIISEWKSKIIHLRQTRVINLPRAKQERRERLEKQPFCVKSDCLMYTCELTSILWFTGMINVSIKQQEAFPCILIAASVISPRAYTVSNRCKERVTDSLNIYFNLISHPRAKVWQQSNFSTLKNFCFDHISALLSISDPRLNTCKFVRDLVPFESGIN